MLEGGCAKFFRNIINLNTYKDSIWEKEFSDGEIKDLKGPVLLFAKAQEFFYETVGDFFSGFLHLPTFQEKKCERLKEIVKQNLDLYIKKNDKNRDHLINYEDYKETNHKKPTLNEELRSTEDYKKTNYKKPTLNEELISTEDLLDTNNSNFENNVTKSIECINNLINPDNKEKELIKQINDIFNKTFHKSDNDAVLNNNHFAPSLLEPDLTFIRTDKKITKIEFNEEDKERLVSLNFRLENPSSKFSFSSLDKEMQILKLCLQINENDILLSDNNQSEISIIKEISDKFYDRLSDFLDIHSFEDKELGTSPHSSEDEKPLTLAQEMNSILKQNMGLGELQHIEPHALKKMSILLEQEMDPLVLQCVIKHSDFPEGLKNFVIKSGIELQEIAPALESLSRSLKEGFCTSPVFLSELDGGKNKALIKILNEKDKIISLKDIPANSVQQKKIEIVTKFYDRLSEFLDTHSFGDNEPLFQNSFEEGKTLSLAQKMYFILEQAKDSKDIDPYELKKMSVLLAQEMDPLVLKCIIKNSDFSEKLKEIVDEKFPIAMQKKQESALKKQQ